MQVRLINELMNKYKTIKFKKHLNIKLTTKLQINLKKKDFLKCSASC